MQSDKPYILVVDDDDFWLNKIAELLKPEFNVQLAGMYIEALRKIVAQRPSFHVIVTDLRLVESEEDNEEGILLTSDLKNKVEESRVILITAYPKHETMRKAFKLSAYDYVPKRDFDVEQFLQIVRDAVADIEQRRKASSQSQKKPRSRVNRPKNKTTSHYPFERSIVRIYKSVGSVAGCGFLIDRKLILTCAHVVNLALNLAPASAAFPQAEIELDFPMASTPKLAAKVVGWLPLSSVSTTWKGDIAGLELRDSSIVELDDLRIEALKIVEPIDAWELDFRSFGFTPDYPDGLHVAGYMLGQNAAGWLQIAARGKDAGIFLQPGFSGTPIWDNELRGVTGMVVARYKEEKEKVAFAIAAPKLLRFWSDTIDENLSPVQPVVPQTVANADGE